MKFRPILVDGTMRELTEHGTEMFPISMDEQHLSSASCAYVKHWHYELQMTLVTKGSVIFRAQDNEYFIKQGEGIFFNSGCLHEAVPTDKKNSVYVCVNFNPKVVYGYTDSLLRQMYVDPVLFASEMQVVPLREEPWHKEICGVMSDLAGVDTEQCYGYEMLMYSLILRIWYLLVVNNREILEKSVTVTFADRQRISRLITFIRRNYAEGISLNDIAQSDHISKGECCRVFKRVLGMTPFNYLISYRLRESIKLLAVTDSNIAEIAQSVGFGSSSYYAECFKKEMHLSPLAYRKHIVKSSKR